MKKAVISLLLILSALTLYAGDALLTVEQEAGASHGMGATFSAHSPVGPVFNGGRVSSLSKDPGNSDNFGKYVEVESSMTYRYKGIEQTDLIYVVYSNFAEILVEVGDAARLDTLLGYSGGPGSNLHPDTDEFFIYIYTKKFSPFLAAKSNNQFIEENGVFWWNPIFITKE